MHAVNGRIFGNNPGLYVEYGTKVTWYLMSLGAEVRNFVHFVLFLKRFWVLQTL